MCGSEVTPRVKQLAGWYLWVAGQTFSLEKEETQHDDWIPQGVQSIQFGLNREMKTPAGQHVTTCFSVTHRTLPIYKSLLVLINFHTPLTDQPCAQARMNQWELIDAFNVLQSCYMQTKKKKIEIFLTAVEGIIPPSILGIAFIGFYIINMLKMQDKSNF